MFGLFYTRTKETAVELIYFMTIFLDLRLAQQDRK